MVRLRKMMNLDVSIFDLYHELDDTEKIGLINLLIEENLLLDSCCPRKKNMNNYLDDIWYDALNKLSSNRFKLSNDDINKILEISNKV